MPVEQPSAVPNRGLIELEQQFQKRQQEIVDRLDQVTRRADDQMRASQARQFDLERQLQQTQMRLYQMQQQQAPPMQQHHQKPAQLQPQQQPQPQQPQQVQVQVQPPRNFTASKPIPPPLTVPTKLPVVNEDIEVVNEEDEIETKDVKEVMVVERLKRRSAPVTLEIDELSISL
jgi:hypothetical protein